MELHDYLIYGKVVFLLGLEISIKELLLNSSIHFYVPDKGKTSKEQDVSV